MGPVEDEVPILVRGDYYGVALFTFGFDSLPQTDQAVFIVGFVEDKAPEVDKEEVFEGGDHVAGVWRDETAGTLGVSPAAAPQEVEQDETAEEEGRDDDEESYDANKKIDCVQSSPLTPLGPLPTPQRAFQCADRAELPLSLCGVETGYSIPSLLKFRECSTKAVLFEVLVPS